MCGTRTERRVQERRGSGSEPIRAAAIANAQLPTPESAKASKADRPSQAATVVDLPEPGVRRNEPAVFREPPANGSHISGPSFLGLNTEPEGSGAEYLLEDEPSRGGLRKLILLVIIAAILGLIFVQWRSSFKASPKASPAKPAPTTSAAPQANSPLPNSDGTAPANTNDNSAAANSAASDPTGNDPKSHAEDPGGSIVPSAAAASPSPSADPPPEKKPPESDAAESATDTKPPEETHLPDHKPSAALLRAQQYLQGRGVPQSCEQGMLYLKAATDKGDPAAAIQMAALYASGHCVKQDRVMAYRWFNSAHELEPANMWIQKNMDQLWSQMSSQERRLAGY
jgi:hypothetical protein